MRIIMWALCEVKTENEKENLIEIIIIRLIAMMLRLVLGVYYVNYFSQWITCTNNIENYCVYVYGCAAEAVAGKSF